MLKRVLNLTLLAILSVFFLFFAAWGGSWALLSSGACAIQYAGGDTKPLVVVKEAQVASHKTGDDCWLMIGPYAFNVTPYLSLHPAGPEKIKAFCGEDATTVFADAHSRAAWLVLERFRVARVE